MATSRSMESKPEASTGKPQSKSPIPPSSSTAVDSAPPSKPNVSPDNHKENAPPTTEKDNNLQEGQGSDGRYVRDKRVQAAQKQSHTMTTESRTIPATKLQKHHSPPAPHHLSHPMPEASPNSANAAMALSSLFRHNQGPPRPYHSPYQEPTHAGHHHPGWGGPPPPRYYSQPPSQQQQQQQQHGGKGGEHPPPRQSLWNRPYSDATKGPTFTPTSDGSKSKATTVPPSAGFEAQSSKNYPSNQSPSSEVLPLAPTPTGTQRAYYNQNTRGAPQRYFPYPPPYPTDNTSPSEARRYRPHPNTISTRKRQPRHLLPGDRHLVTPTPKKIKLSHSPNPNSEEYSRKSKSLGLLCENFCKRNWEAHSNNMISIDEAAKSLGVERRRIYDIINILESLEIVQRKCKNAYHWLGFQRLPDVLAAIQKEGIALLPEEAARLLGASEEGSGGDGAGKEAATAEAATTAKSTESSNAEIVSTAGSAKKSLGRLSRQFLQLFLVGNSVMSLTEASDRIMGKVDVSSHKEEHRKSAYVKAQKTKIRRLYDIANVLASIGLVQKTDGERRSRPTFLWIYHWTPKQIRELALSDNREDGDASTATPEAGKTPQARKETDDGREEKKQDTPGGRPLPKGPSSASPHGSKTVLSRIHEHGAREEPAPTGKQRPPSSRVDGPGKGNFLHTQATKS